ncbi:hypothetical protein EYB53_024580 [Candidatus Chloroploca sp. M-50]|uniref:Uncharacterized protein n=1 Tax=Candidatus Chloroploca mongolica TaxID=2528176 RepID=A0ABS4DHL5_9CHLR|nr:hypothetical protein [Candidatus Chloroploca mongolica]MBP1468908.1 hypothetical protein [Candidatus Chloroploca mongolica]
MTATAQQYTREIQTNLKYHAIWLPGTPIDLGAIGDVQDGVFVPMDNITQALAIPVQPELLPEHGGESILHQSQSGVTYQTKVGGETSALFKWIGAAEAGIAFDFKRQGACVLSLQGCRTRRIANQLALQRELLKRIDYHWKLSYAVITEVVLAGSGTVLVCEDNQAYIELTAGGAIKNPLADLGRADLNLRIAHSEGTLFSIVGATNFTPLFRAIRVSQGWFNKISVGSLGSEEEINVDAMGDDEVAQAFEGLEI